MTELSLEQMVDGLKAAAEPSRLRILKLLSGNDLTVSDLTTILGQSQPRVSRHLKLLMESGLVHRWQEGSWALFRVKSSGAFAAIVDTLIAATDADDETLARDAERLEEVKRERRERASNYFSSNAASWDEIRSLHVEDAIVERHLLALAGPGPFNSFLDIGTGTGRMLEVFAPHCRSAVGIDSNREMLNIARSNLDAAGIGHAEVRLGDGYNLALGRDRFDLIIIHQVLHYLDDPFAAINEARRALAPSGKLLIVDFAPHDHEFLRDQHQHQRLGFDNETVARWFDTLDLEAGDPVVIDAQLDAAGATGAPSSLTVMIWSGTDTRILVADEKQRVVA